MGEDRFEEALTTYIKKRQNRVVGAILHAYDSKAPSNQFKNLVKTKLNDFAKEMIDLCSSFGQNAPVFFNLIAEDISKEVEKANASTKESSRNKVKA